MNKLTLGVMLYVKDIEKSVDFYQRILGFHFSGWRTETGSTAASFLAAGSPQYVELDADVATISLHRRDAQPIGGGVIFHLRVSELETIVRHLQETHIEFHGPTRQPWGWTTITVMDPDHHEWTIYVNDAPDSK